MSKYSEALEAFEAGFENETISGCRMWGFNLPVEKAKDVMQALRIADRLKREACDVDMLNALRDWSVEKYKQGIGHEVSDEIFQVISKELLKEEENK